MLPSTSREATWSSSGILVHTVGWGCVAECLTSVCFPLIRYSELNVTSTLLNVLGPLLAGATQAINDATTDPFVRQYCSCFQGGFITVFTSFAFMTEQVTIPISCNPNPTTSLNLSLVQGWG